MEFRTVMFVLLPNSYEVAGEAAEQTAIEFLGNWPAGKGLKLGGR